MIFSLSLSLFFALFSTTKGIDYAAAAAAAATTFTHGILARAHLLDGCHGFMQCLSFDVVVT